MSDLSIGVILLVVGMLGTLGSLAVVSLMIVFLKRFFPYVKETEGIR